jgi:glycosyltransferase involved in cell wall biosynthesis
MIQEKNIVMQKKNIIMFISFILLLIIYLIFNYIRNNIKNIEMKKEIKEKIIIEKNLDEEYKDILEFLYMSRNFTLYEPNKAFNKSDNPKISIIIATYNGEPYINNTIFSIQNQDFNDVEIIVVDDCSQDNTVKVIEELMKIDPRIVLYQNEENKGTLYTKTKGILNCKGKYVMILDQDDTYAQRDAFSTLYYYAKNNNLDMLGFSSFQLDISLHNKPKPIMNYFETQIIYQPYIKNVFYNQTVSGQIIRNAPYIWNHIYKSELFKNTIKQIDDKYMNRKMNCGEDCLLLFLLTRNAYNYKQIKRIFYIQLHLNIKNPYKQYNEEQRKNKDNIKCQSYLNFIELVLAKTENNTYDKNIASYELENTFLNNHCKTNQFIRETAKNICKLFLENKYINEDIKNKISIYLNQINLI